MAGADGHGEGQGRPALTHAATIVALSSGAPPAAIAILRISGPGALAAATALAGPLPPPRRAGLRALRAGNGSLLDRALVLVFPADRSATGEDLVELHCHGGRAVVAAVERAVLAQPGTRGAEPGEFTRRALLNGRIDLAQAQGLADLLSAETEAGRRRAIEAAEGHVSRAIRDWMDRLTTIAAHVEASIDFAEEDDVAQGAASLRIAEEERAALAAEMRAVLAAPPVERWHDGWRIVVAGPPNAGKSTLVNLLGGREAAIVSPIAGTTRDRVEVAVQRNGVGYVLTDTAGLRGDPVDPIERIGIDRARQSVEAADVVLWLGSDPPGQPDHLWIHAKADLPGRSRPAATVVAVSQHDGASIERLWLLIETVLAEQVSTTAVPLHREEREACGRALDALERPEGDEVMLAEALRVARRELGSIIGANATEQMLDRLFTRFCVGK